MDAASTSGGEVTSQEIWVQDRYAWVDAEVLGTASRYCGETELILRHYRVAPSQLHPNAWVFIKAFEILCLHLGIVPTVGVFTHYFDVCPRKAGPRGWVSLRAHNGRPLLSLYVDSAKYSGVSFKRDFFKVIPKDGVFPFWRNSWDEQESPISIYWDRRHYDWGPKMYSTTFDHLTPPEKDVVYLLQEAIKERGGYRYSSRLLVDSLPDQLAVALEEDQMNIRDLLKKAKAIGADEPKAKDSRKRKVVDDSAATLSNNQSLPPPPSTAESEQVRDPPAESDPKQVDGDKKKKSKVPPKGPTDCPKAGGGSSSEVPVLTRAMIFGDNFSPNHPAVVSQFYTEEIPAERAKENYDKALKASTSAIEKCAKIKMKKEALTVQLGTIGKEKKDLEQKLGEMELLKKKVEDLGKDLLAAEERRKEDLRKQQEIHDAEVAELKRKLEAAIEGERKSVFDTLRYVEKAFDVTIEQVKVRNPAYNLDLRGLSYEYEVIDGVVVWVDGDKKIEVPPEGLPAATGAQTDA
ncbi:hypothetical protein SESBI_14961 [Sesbania bispinosa]|nr:hypothetical protein SESBI_14961 [Sesbania bispinosa]